MLEHRGLGARLRTAGGGRTREESSGGGFGKTKADKEQPQQHGGDARWTGAWTGSLSPELSEEGNGEAGHLEKLHFEGEQRNERGSGFQRQATAWRQAIFPRDPEREATREGARGRTGSRAEVGRGVPLSGDSSATVAGRKAAKTGTGPDRLGALEVGLRGVSCEIGKQ